MKTTNEYIDIIKTHSDEFRIQFGVRTLRLFGLVLIVPGHSISYTSGRFRRGRGRCVLSFG